MKVGGHRHNRQLVTEEPETWGRFDWNPLVRMIESKSEMSQSLETLKLGLQLFTCENRPALTSWDKHPVMLSSVVLAYKMEPTQFQISSLKCNILNDMNTWKHTWHKILDSLPSNMERHLAINELIRVPPSQLT